VYYSPCRRGDSDTVFSESNQSSIIKIPFSKSSLNQYCRPLKLFISTIQKCRPDSKMDTETPPAMEALGGKQRRHYKISTVFHVIGIAWGAAVFGYGGSIIGTTLGQPSFIKYMGLDTAPNADQLLGAMNALFYIGGMIGGFLAGFLSDKYGRKFTVLFGAAITLVGTALTAGSVNIAMFIVFRAVVGLGYHSSQFLR
jgi:hypothetical protein